MRYCAPFTDEELVLTACRLMPSLLKDLATDLMRAGPRARGKYARPKTRDEAELRVRACVAALQLQGKVQVRTTRHRFEGHRYQGDEAELLPESEWRIVAVR